MSNTELLPLVTEYKGLHFNQWGADVAIKFMNDRGLWAAKVPHPLAQCLVMIKAEDYPVMERLLEARLKWFGEESGEA